MISTPDEDYSRRRRRSWALRRRLALGLALLLIAVGVLLSVHGARGYYEYSPGDAPLVTASADCVERGSAGDLTLPDGHPCVRLVVPAGRAATVDGRLMMVDVLVGSATPWDYALMKLDLLGLLRPDNQLVPAAEELGTTPASQLGCQETQEMNGATQSAAIAALSRLGYHVGVDQLGAQVDEVVPGSAAALAGVHCNDLVTEVGTTPVDSPDQLAAAIRALGPGSRITLTVERTGSNGVQQRVVLRPTLTGVPAMPAADGEAATPADPGEAFLGVATQDDVRYVLPFQVSIEVGDIGGPSAGLALTLGLLDVLTQGKLTGGHDVAATGTISPDGAVGDVGGVAQKTVAVRRAGAQLFLVPPEELATARSHAGSMPVEAVSTLDQALDDLHRLGGTFTLPSAATGASGSVPAS